MIKNHHKKAFTLIELILYFGLFSIILGVLTNLFSVIVDTQTEVESTSAVENDSKFITTRLMYDIQRADSISMPAALGSQTSSLTLVIDGTTYTYAINNGNLQLTVGTDTNTLNGSLTQLSNISFQKFGNIGGKHAIRLQFTMDSRNQTAAGQETKQIETMIGLR
jgi:type II secretory pathway pseudopilin PulG